VFTHRRGLSLSFIGINRTEVERPDRCGSIDPHTDPDDGRGAQTEGRTLMTFLAIAWDEAITWGDLVIVLAVVALLAFVFAYFPRRRG
jgi:hypothetical protein